jgi:rubrerythrin
LIAAFVAILLITFFPLQYIAKTAEKNIDSYVDEHTEHFSDTIRKKGFLDTATYEAYIEMLDSSGEYYDVEIEDIHPVTGDEVAKFDDKEGLVNLSAKSAGTTGNDRNGYSYENKLQFLSLNKEGEVNGMKLLPSQEDEIQSFAAHVHTGDCYEGHQHIDPLSGVNLSNAPVRMQYETGAMYYYNGAYYPSDVRVSIRCGQCNAEIYVFSLYRGSTAKLADVYIVDKGVFSFSRVVHGGVDKYGDPNFLVSNIYSQFQSYMSIAGSIPGGGYDQSGRIYTSGIFNFSLAGLPIWDSNAVLSYKPFNGCTSARNFGHTMNENACYPVGYKGKIKLTGGVYWSDNADNAYFTATCNTCRKDIVQSSIKIYSPGGSSSGFSSASSFARLLIKNSLGNIEDININTSMSAHFGSSDREWDNFRTYSSEMSSAYRQLRDQLAPYTTYNNGSNGSIYVESIDFPLTGFPIRCGSYPGAVLLWLPYMGCPYCGTYGTNYSCGLPQDTTYDCDKVVTSIEPMKPVQTVKKGESIITTAIATYLDGHIGIVNCTSNFNTNQAGNQTVTLTYSGLVGNAKTTGTRTCMVNVTVIDKNLEYISVTPSPISVSYKGTPYFAVRAYYSDESSAIIPSGKYSTSTYDTSISGKQSFVVAYAENGITKTAWVNLYVDSLLSITPMPNEITVDKYTKTLPIWINANYLYTGSRGLVNGFTISGYNPAVIGNQIATVSFYDQWNTVTATVLVHVTPLHNICSRCGNKYEMNPDDTDPGCPFCNEIISGITVSPEEVEVTQGNSLPVTVRAVYRDGTSKIVSGWTSNYDPNKIGLQPVTIEYGGFAASIYVWVKEAEIACPICGTYYPASEGRCPVCREKITGIHVFPGEITVNQYENIVLEVTATYADEVSAPVTVWSIDKTSSVAWVFTATVSYGGFTAQVKLTVLSASSVTCPICGLVYDVGEYPNGCPVCSGVVTGIEAFLSSGSRLVQYGSVPAISVVLVFLDTHREIIETGYTTEGFNPFQMGEQTIIVRYKEFSCILDVKVVNTLETVTCPNGHVYYLNEDGSDPGCPFCVIGDHIGIVIFYDITYLPEILEELYTVGTYYFDQNNFLTVRVTKRDHSLVAKLQETSLKLVMLGRKRRFTYGGEVL